MERDKASLLSTPIVRGWLNTIGILVVFLSLPVYVGANLWYGETKGPFKNWMQVADLEGDGDLDVVVSHTRWEEVDISWAGIGRWINQGNGKFERLVEEGTEYFAGFAAGLGDVDQDGDPDLFVQSFAVRLLENQAGKQAGEGGKFRPVGGIKPPAGYDQEYIDMGGSFAMGDLNGDGWLDAVVLGCCYGMDASRPGESYQHHPSVSWAWINDGKAESYPTGSPVRIEALDGLPVRQAALGDVDGDGDLDLLAAVGEPTLGRVDSVDDVILLNDGLGIFTPFDQWLGETDSTSVALGDVNGDGQLDALVGTNEGASLWINQGYDEGTAGGAIFVPAEQEFGAEQTVGSRLQARFSSAANNLLGLYLPYGSTRTKAVFLEDLDGDGDLDALVARVWGAEVWWNDGSGIFSRSDVRIPYPEDSGIAVADFDGDGDLDIFTGNNGLSYRLWLNNGEGDFH